MIIALHGFLGHPHDWDELKMENIEAFGIHWIKKWKTIEEWAFAFNQEIAAKTYVQKPVLMGYSLGGRLALHALIQNPNLWQGGIIISAHPGLKSEQERRTRLCEDERWAKRFETEEWEPLMQAWNKRPVLASSQAFERQEKTYSRAALAEVLRQASLGKQADLREAIAHLSLPVLWITGTKDQMYAQLASSLSFAHPFSAWKNISEAGHRVPWDQPVRFKQVVYAFLSA